MVSLKYNINIESEIVKNKLDKMTNQIFKLLPCREEGLDWQTPLANLITDITGMFRILQECQGELFILLCKMEALLALTAEDDFLQFRKVIFECLGLINNIKKCL